MAEISRRTVMSRSLLVVAVAGGAVLGMTKSVHHRVAVPPPPAPTGLTVALSLQRSLLSGYDTALAGVGGDSAKLNPLRADIAAHGTALEAILQRYPGWRLAQSTPSPSASASAVAVDGTIQALRSASKTASARLAASCLAWPSTEQNAAEAVPLLGSISACLATHVEVLS
jgi:hypothetical protein